MTTVRPTIADALLDTPWCPESAIKPTARSQSASGNFGRRGTSVDPATLLDTAGVAACPGPHLLPSRNTVRLEPRCAFRRGGDLHIGLLALGTAALRAAVPSAHLRPHGASQALGNGSDYLPFCWIYLLTGEGGLQWRRRYRLPTHVTMTRKRSRAVRSGRGSSASTGRTTRLTCARSTVTSLMRLSEGTCPTRARQPGGRVVAAAVQRHIGSAARKFERGRKAAVFRSATAAGFLRTL